MEYLTLFLSLRCTQKCMHCLYGCSPLIGDHMSWDVFIKSVAIAKENRIKTLNFFGGEPMLNPLFFRMLQNALENHFSLMIATNCRLFSEGSFLTDFLQLTKNHKSDIHIFTARDKFHLRFFDPADIVGKLRFDGYEISVSKNSNTTILLSKYNTHYQELRRLNTNYSCCQSSWTDYLGILPGGGWTICPPSLEPFGDIFSESLLEIVSFKRGLPLRYTEGCSECLKDFKTFREEFEKYKSLR
jgi:organic radical activating enzyme